jgi:hypothetical protein
MPCPVGSVGQSMARPYRWIRPPVPVVLLQRLSYRRYLPGKTSPLFRGEAGFSRCLLIHELFSREQGGRGMQRPCPDAGMLAEPSPFSGSESTAFPRYVAPFHSRCPLLPPPPSHARAACVHGGHASMGRPLKESRSNRQLGVAGRRKRGLGRAWHPRQLATAASRHMDPEFRLNRSRPDRLLARSPKVQNRTSHVDIKTSWGRLVALLPTWLRALPKTSPTAASAGGKPSRIPYVPWHGRQFFDVAGRGTLQLTPADRCWAMEREVGRVG